MNRIAPAALVLAAAAGLSAAGCASSPGAVAWDVVHAWQGEHPIERIRSGRPDPTDPNLELVSVDQAGVVALVRFDGETPTSRVIFRHTAGLTGLFIADLDPDVPGEEIYIGGGSEGMEKWPPLPKDGGVVVQLVLVPGGEPRARTVYEGPAYVHSIEPLPPERDGDPVRMVVTDYLGRVLLATPVAGEGAWPVEQVHAEPASADPEYPKVKDTAILADPAGGAGHELLLVLKGGRAVYVDLRDPASSRVLLEEPGGLSRVEADPDGGAFVTGYAGRVLRFTRDGEGGFRIEPIHLEGPDSGLRGAVQGRFPVPGGDAMLAVFGYSMVVRTLTPRLGTWDTFTVYRDDGKGHCIHAADVVPGNDADEIAVAGYANRITVLVPHRE